MDKLLININKDYLKDLEEIVKIWHQHGKPSLTLDELVNDGIDMFISSFAKNNKSIFNRISKKDQHHKY